MEYIKHRKGVSCNSPLLSFSPQRKIWVGYYQAPLLTRFWSKYPVSFDKDTSQRHAIYKMLYTIHSLSLLRNEGKHDLSVALEELTTLAANPCKRKVISLVRYHLYQHCAWPINRLYISLLVRFRNFPTTAYTTSYLDQELPISVQFYQENLILLVISHSFYT